MRTDFKEPLEASDLKYGARVFPLPDGKAIVKQTIKRGVGATDRYVIDSQRECHVNLADDSSVAAAVRDALAGRL